MIVATSTLALSVGAAMTQFAAAVTSAAADATALNRVVTGLADGKDYGRYFAAEDPLVPYIAASVSVSAMIAQGALLRQAVAAAIATAQSNATSNLSAFIPSITQVTEALRAACANPADAIRLLSALASFVATLPVSAAGDPIGAQVTSLINATAVTMRRAAAVSLARAAATYQPTSYQDAATVRNQVATVLDAIIGEAGDLYDDVAYRALKPLKDAVVADLTARGGALAPVVTRRFGARQSGLSLSYRLYQDATREGDVVARNDCPHPAFLPATVEVLAR